MSIHGNHWTLDPEVTFLNHESFGACPQAVLAAQQEYRSRLVLIDHVTSQTALVFPVGRIVSELRSRGVSVLVDGAHAPGMLSLDLEGIGADYYTGNCHKWVCAPKGAAFLYVRPDLQGDVRPAVISHGANAGFAGRERFRVEFDWMGTADPTAWICVGEAIRCMGSLLPGGWGALREHNHALALAGRRIVAEALGVGLPGPDEMIGSMASLPLPPSSGFEAPRSALDLDPLHDWLFERNIEVPVLGCPAVDFRLLRISAQLYNQTRDYERLAALLRSVDWD